MDDDLKLIENSAMRYGGGMINDSSMDGYETVDDGQGGWSTVPEEPQQKRGLFGRRKKPPMTPGYGGGGFGGGGYGEYSPSPSYGGYPGSGGHSQQRPPDFTGVQIEHLSEEEKEELLRSLLKGHNDHTNATRDLYLEEERLNITNRKRFSELGYGFVRWGGIGIACAIVVLLGLTGYAVVYDRQIIDSGIISGFLATFGEIIKAIFTAV